jgi:hypothetical protein
MLRRILIGAVVAAAFVSPAVGQDAQDQAKPAPSVQQPTPQTPQNAPRPDPGGQPLNVRVELTITDQVGTSEPYKKVVTLIVADRQRGFVRSRGDLRTGDNRWRTLSINVDARPVLIRDGLLRLDLGLEYQPQPIMGGGATNVAEPGSWVMNEQVGVVLDSGKPLVVSQAFDPTSDRKISVELKGTILR